MPTSTPARMHAAARPLAGRVALVTGASAGIGAEFARFVAERGAAVALVARRAERLEALARELEHAHGVRVVAVAADLADSSAPERIVAECTRVLGAPDILVNNAGYGPRAGCLDAPWSETAEFMQVMVTSYVELTIRVVPAMRARGYGRIIQVSSLASFAPETRGSLYGPAKRFLTSLARALALELEGTGVHITASCPGFTRTEFHDVMGNRSHMEKLPSWMWGTSREVVNASWRAVEAARPVVVVGALNQFIAFLCWLLPRWAMNAISPKAVATRRDAAAAGARGSGAAGAVLVALASAVVATGVLTTGGCTARNTGESAPTEGARAALGSTPASAPPSDLVQLQQDISLVYLNLAAVIAANQTLSDGAIARLGEVLPAVKADCEAGRAVDWNATRTRLLEIGATLGARLGMATPTARKNAGVLLPPDARVTWNMRAAPAPDTRRTSGEAAYRIAEGGSVRIEAPARSVELAVRAGTLTIAGFEDASRGERIAELLRADLSLRVPGGGEIEIALAEGTPSRAVLLKADGTGLITAAFTLRSTDPVMEQYVRLFGTARLTMDFALREGTLDFAAAGALPALLVAPSELPLEPGRDVCANLPAPDWLAPPSPGQTPELARPAGSAWTNAQLEILRTYCTLRAETQQTRAPS